MLFRDPCVFVVGRAYQIVLNTLEYGIAWVEVGEKRYRDSTGGLMRSETLIHRVEVPMDLLDAQKSYTVCFRALPERRAYFPQLGELQRRTYAFRPADFSDGLQAIMLADTHSQVELPSRAAKYFGEKLDLLIMNGDIPAESKQMSDLLAIYELLDNVTGGGIPVVFARGNHDYRGRLAIEMPQYIGTREGKTYFTFRLGSLWGIVLDCGEDKVDAHEEYGGLVDCHDMRLEETAFLQDVIARADEEYLAPGVQTRICLSHIPFPSRLVEEREPIFNIEQEIFMEWTQLLNQMRLDVMLCGHMHKLSVNTQGNGRLRFGAEFPVIVAAEAAFTKEKALADYWAGTLEIKDGGMRISGVDEQGNVKLLWEKRGETDADE